MNSITSVINYKFVNEDILKEALTHPNVGAVNRISKHPLNYERLEFLGDCILELIIADLTYNTYPDDNSGELTKRKQGLTCGKALVRIAKQIDLSNFTIINKEISSCNDSCLENTMEALIGAVYLDGGFENARRFVHDHWENLINSDSYLLKDENVKSEIKTWTYRNNYPLPQYKLIAEKGPIHNKSYTVSLNIKSFKSVTASGPSIKNAEKKAAELILNHIKRELPQNFQRVSHENSSSNDDQVTVEKDHNVETFFEKQEHKRVSGEMETPRNVQVDPKSMLQGWSQRHKVPLPKYTVVQQSGVDHDPLFKVEARVDSVGSVWACSSTKKHAEKTAAKLLLNCIKGLEDMENIGNKDTKNINIDCQSETRFKDTNKPKPIIDYKSELQHWTQKNKYTLPIYKILKDLGRTHSGRFMVEASVDTIGSVFGSAPSKKGAEHEAAKILLRTVVKDSS